MAILGIEIHYNNTGNTAVLERAVLALTWEVIAFHYVSKVEMNNKSSCQACLRNERQPLPAAGQCVLARKQQVPVLPCLHILLRVGVPEPIDFDEHLSGQADT